MLTEIRDAVPRRFSAKVVGLTFVDGYPKNLKRLRQLHEDREIPDAVRGYMESTGEPLFAGWGEYDVEPLAVVLVRNPDNPYDSNAIEVHVPALVGFDGSEDGMVGHVENKPDRGSGLRKGLASRLAPYLDDGGLLRTGVASVLVDPGHEDRPGLSICVERVDDDAEVTS